MTVKELPLEMNYRPYKTIQFEHGEGNFLMFTQTIKFYELENDTYGSHIPPMYAILKVTGEDILITMELDSIWKGFTLSIPKNTKCIIYRHKDFKILDEIIDCSYY